MTRKALLWQKIKKKGREVSTVMASYEEGNDSCMYMCITDGAFGTVKNR